MALQKNNIRHLSKEELQTALKELGEPAFRAKQIWQWLWEKGVTSFEEMTNLPKPLREKLESKFEVFRMEIAHKQMSSDGTIKIGLRLHDGELVEGVLIPKDDRMTACISSQVGCSLACAFCATAKLPRKRNLYFDEIYDQVVWIDRLAREHYNQPLTNIVFMGMGEPLLNYSQMMQAIDRITSPDGLGMSPKRITVSTAGIAKMIKKLADDETRFHLALSLHAPTDAQRSQIMPINETNSLDALTEALQYYTDKIGSRITLEYVMLQGVNDSLEDADKLAAFSRRFASKINMIEYNPVEGTPFGKTSGNQIYRFKDRLEMNGVIANVRRSRGKDIDAACGQLANKNKDKAVA